MLVQQFSFGDKVVHTGRPEWGTGLITAALGDIHEGKPCQKLTIRFDRVGVKTISTAIASLIPAQDAPAIAAHTGDGQPDPLAGPSAKSVRELMTKLPDPCTDAFMPHRARLAATIALYRYTDQGASLLDWAAAQSRLKDPMSTFSRHELEELFRRYAWVREEHLKRLAGEMRRVDPAGLTELTRSAPRGAQQVLKRFDTPR